MKIQKQIWVAGLLLTGTFAYASIPTQSQPPIEKILTSESHAKFAKLKKLGPHVYTNLKTITFDEKRPLGMRWQAFMAMTRLGEKESLPEVERAFKSKEWFLRGAALRVMPLLDDKRAYEFALKSAANDSALVVRSQAVDTLGELKDPRCSDTLWTQLYSKTNYMKNQSLWIRRHIVEVLAEVAPQGSESKFIKVLDDADATLYAPAIKGLERLSKQKLGDTQMPPVFKRHLWKKWFEEKKKSAST